MIVKGRWLCLIESLTMIVLKSEWLIEYDRSSGTNWKCQSGWVLEVEASCQKQSQQSDRRLSHMSSFQLT